MQTLSDVLTRDLGNRLKFDDGLVQVLTFHCQAWWKNNKNEKMHLWG